MQLIFPMRSDEWRLKLNPSNSLSTAFFGPWICGKWREVGANPTHSIRWATTGAVRIVFTIYVCCDYLKLMISLGKIPMIESKKIFKKFTPCNRGTPITWVTPAKSSTQKHQQSPHFYRWNSITLSLEEGWVSTDCGKLDSRSWTTNKGRPQPSQNRNFWCAHFAALFLWVGRIFMGNVSQFATFTHWATDEGFDFRPFSGYEFPYTIQHGLTAESSNKMILSQCQIKIHWKVMLKLWLDFMLQPPNFFRYSSFHGLLGRYDVPKPHFDALNVRQVTLNNQVLSPWLAEFERVFPKRKISKKGNQPSLFVLPKKIFKQFVDLDIWWICRLFGDL